MPKTGVGLLFMSFQKSIVNQFEFIQKTFANSPSFPTPNTGMDPIIGQGLPTSNGKYAKKYNDKTTLTVAPFEKFVTMKGGEYFFAPSIPFLKAL
jgi:deferrochelatase/peroxidase EfeB